MSQEWAERILILLDEAKNNKKNKFLSSVMRQVLKYGCDKLPTEGQLRIISPMWEKREQRKIIDIIGENVCNSK